MYSGEAAAGGKSIVKKITAILGEVYNEEHRIEYTLRSLQMFDEIIVIDKSSEDRTREIAEKYGAVVYEIPNTDYRTDEVTRRLKDIWDSARNEWVFWAVASDIIHPDMYDIMIRAINDPKCDVDCFRVPLYRFSMGFVSRRSYYGTRNYGDTRLLKKGVRDWTNKDIHAGGVNNRWNKKLFIRDKRIAVYHLTHENHDIIMERILRYAVAETETFQGDRQASLKYAWKELKRQIYYYFRRGTFTLGDEGKAQLCMLLIYRASRYLNAYFDAQKEKEIKDRYDEIRNRYF